MSKEKQIEIPEEEMGMSGYSKYSWRLHSTKKFTMAQAQLADQIMREEGYRKQNEGEWVDEPNFAQKGLKGKYYVCSNCNVCVPAIEELPLYQWEYCPRCGAKMKGGAE